MNILYTRRVEPPGVICTATPSILLYVDESKTPREIHWLYLSCEPPKPAEGRKIVHTHLGRINDMCFVQDGDKQLLIITNYEEGLFAYNTNTDRLEWKVFRNPYGMKENMDVRGITTDGNGRLFVSDGNNHCIHVYSLSDGSYMNCLLKDDHPLYKPGTILWCEKTASLIVACDFFWKEKYSVKVIKVEF